MPTYFALETVSINTSLCDFVLSNMEETKSKRARNVFPNANQLYGHLGHTDGEKLSKIYGLTK